jgi:hypothetical protein
VEWAEAYVVRTALSEPNVVAHKILYGDCREDAVDGLAIYHIRVYA